MSTVLIARFKSKKEANRVTRFIQEQSKPSRLVTGSHLDDLYLGELIEEGMRDRRNQSAASFKKYLDKKINSAKG